jgi:hypothetical protein
MSAAWQAFLRWQAGPQGHQIPVPSDWGEMQGKIKGRGTAWRDSSVCTWGWRGTRRIAAPCRVDRQSLASIGKGACIARRIALALDGSNA